MKIAVFHGSPRRGNTYAATLLFLEELNRRGGAEVTEFFLPEAAPEFCMGCQKCLGGPNTDCPHSSFIAPIVETILESDALLFASPHYGACEMPGGMKNLFDHLDFFTMTVAPRREMFDKKAFVITTGAGSARAAKTIHGFVKKWGVNRVLKFGVVMYADSWDNMKKTRRAGYERKLRRAARKFYRIKKSIPYISTFIFYYIARYIVKNFIGKGNYPYEYWKEEGFFDKRPF